jgi:predicted nucleotidyltransferase
MFFEKVFRKLSEHKVQYIVIGGVAVNLLGHARATHDLDLILVLDPANVRRFADCAKALNLKPRVPVDIEEIADKKKRESWINEKNMKVFTVINPDNDFEIVDIMVIDYLDFEMAYKNRVVVKLKDFEVNVICLEDLIKLKEIAGRDKDKLDLKILKAMRELSNE